MPMELLGFAVQMSYVGGQFNQIILGLFGCKLWQFKAMYDEDMLTHWYLIAHVEIGIEISQIGK